MRSRYRRGPQAVGRLGRDRTGADARAASDPSLTALPPPQRTSLALRLSTIVLISRELQRTLHDNGQVAADIKTLREQAQRCRDILAKITQLSASGAPFDA